MIAIYTLFADKTEINAGLENVCTVDISLLYK